MVAIIVLIIRNNRNIICGMNLSNVLNWKKYWDHVYVDNVGILYCIISLKWIVDRFSSNMLRVCIIHCSMLLLLRGYFIYSV